MSCGVGRRCGSDALLLWLWCRPAAAADSTPNLGASICRRCGPKKTKEKKKTEYGKLGVEGGQVHRTERVWRLWGQTEKGCRGQGEGSRQAEPVSNHKREA